MSSDENEKTELHNDEEPPENNDDDDTNYDDNDNDDVEEEETNQDEEEDEDQEEETNQDEEEDEDQEEETNQDEEEETNQEEEEEDQEEETNQDEEEEDQEEETNQDEEEEDQEEETNQEEEEDDDEEEPEMSEEECLNYFKECLQEYLKLEEEIRTLEKATKLRRTKKNKLSESILSYIQQKDISHVKLQGNYKGKQIESRTSVKKSSVSFKTITNIIFEHFEDINDAKKLMEKINSNRTEKTTSKLRIGKEGKSKNTSQKLSSMINNISSSSEAAEPQVPANMQYLYTTPIND
jgi:hypothetical protein